MPHARVVLRQVRRKGPAVLAHSVLRLDRVQPFSGSDADVDVDAGAGRGSGIGPLPHALDLNPSR